MAVELGIPEVDSNNRVTISWTHTPATDNIPVRSFNLTGEIVGRPAAAGISVSAGISLSAPPDALSIEIPSHLLSLKRTYYVSIVADIVHTF